MADISTSVNVTMPGHADDSSKDKKTSAKNSKKLKSSTVKDAISKRRTLTGSPPDQININPIQEEQEEKAVMSFGRFNPPTVGHEKLIRRVEDIAQNTGAQAHIVASHSEGNSKNPVPKDAKISYIKKLTSKGTKVSSSSKEHPSILHAAVKLHNAGVKHLTVVGGADRVDDYHKLLHQYNGMPSKHGLYHFKSINVVSAGARDPDSEGTEGMSGTKMRHFARSGHMEEFKKGLPKALHDHAAEIANHIKSVKEDIDDEFDDLITEITMQSRLRKSMVMRRYQSKLSLAKKRAMLRRANSKVIANRARKLAVQKMKTKLAGGRDPNTLSPMEKQRIENIVSKRKVALRRLAMRLVPQVRKKEASRFLHKEDLDLTNMVESNELLNAIYDVAIEEINRSDTHLRDKGTKSLVKIYKHDTPGEKTIKESSAEKDNTVDTIEAIKNRFNPDYFEKRKKNKETENKKEEVKEDIDSIFEAEMDREAIMRSGQDRKKEDLVARDNKDRKKDIRPFHLQSIVKKVVDEETELDETSKQLMNRYTAKLIVKHPDVMSKHPVGKDVQRKKALNLAMDKLLPSSAINKPKVAATEETKVWDKPAPKGKTKHLTPAQKARAKARARAAGRPYPNLVDNMAVAKEEYVNEVSNELIGKVNKIRTLHGPKSKTPAAAETLNKAVEKVRRNSEVGKIK